MQVGVETYGGGIWHSWFDRDLSIAGRIVVADGKGSFSSKLVNVERPILRIPTLAIHCKTRVLEKNTSLMTQPVDHHLALLSLLANEHSMSPEEIHDFEL